MPFIESKLSNYLENRTNQRKMWSHSRSHSIPILIVISSVQGYWLSTTSMYRNLTQFLIFKPHHFTYTLEIRFQIWTCQFWHKFRSEKQHSIDPILRQSYERSRQPVPIAEQYRIEFNFKIQFNYISVAVYRCPLNMIYVNWHQPLPM